jgi:hypothetical protein
MKKKIVIVSMNKFLSILLALLVCGCTVSTETEK